jgi:hypothetical protein
MAQRNHKAASAGLPSETRNSKSLPEAEGGSLYKENIDYLLSLRPRHSKKLL